MGKISQLNQKLDIQEQACLWISKLDRELSSEEKVQLGDWLEQTPKHREALLEMAEFWDDLTALNQLSTLFPLEQTMANRHKNWGALAIAASFALVSLVSANLLFNGELFSFNGQVQQANTNSFTTEVGEQANFMLPDGTKIHLNTDSVVNIAYTTTHRQLSLVKGEASFDVAKDKLRPFTVTAGSQSFTALGTVFNVQKNNESAMELVVTEGRVLITKAEQPLETITQLIGKEQAQLLPGTLVTSGEKAIIKRDIKAPVTKVPLEQLQRDLAWQQGMLIFEGEPLEQALTEVERYTSIKFEVTDPQLAKLKVAGYFKAGDIDGLLASLSSNFNIVTNRYSEDLIKLAAAK